MRVLSQRELNAITAKIVADHRSKSKKRVQQRVLLEWRAMLATEPTSLASYQIDQVMREVRARLGLPD
jgi:hypothetical protein